MLIRLQRDDLEKIKVVKWQHGPVELKLYGRDFSIEILFNSREEWEEFLEELWGEK